MEVFKDAVASDEEDDDQLMAEQRANGGHAPSTSGRGGRPAPSTSGGDASAAVTAVQGVSKWSQEGYYDMTKRCVSHWLCH